MNKKVTVDEFIRRSKLNHDIEYDYSKVEFDRVTDKVLIGCPVHGYFYQQVTGHMRGGNCRKCASKIAYDKSRKTCMERYGSPWAMSDKSVQEKMKKTNIEKYGNAYPLQNDVCKKNMVNTMLDKYGVTNADYVPEFREKMRETCFKNLGVYEPLSSNEVREKIKKTNIEKYGGPAPLCSSEIKDKLKNTCLEKYGVESVILLSEVQSKIKASKEANNTFSTSVLEDAVYDLLCDKFGINDISRHHCSDVYPFHCDFYIKSRDLYIELNAHWTHNDHWFTGSDEDLSVVELWKSRDTSYYRNVIHVWTCADVKKREAAMNNNLKYVVFWKTDMSDVNLWFESGCPDRKDWI